MELIISLSDLPEQESLIFLVSLSASIQIGFCSGVAYNRLVKMNMDNGENIKTWRFTNMKKWHVNWEIRHLKVQFEEEDIEFKPLSADCKVIIISTIFSIF